MTTPLRAPAAAALAMVTAAALVAPTVAAPAGAAPPEMIRTGCDATPATPTALPPLSPERLAEAIAGLPDDEASGALVQVRGSAGCWSGTSGLGRLHPERPVPSDGRFRIGSMTKMFTAAVALQLVAEGRLDLDATVQGTLPGFLPADYPPITVRQVLTYTSGINGIGVPHKDPDWFFVHRFDHWEPGSQLDLTRPLAFPPGTRQRYGNADYWLAGLLIEKVTGSTWTREVTDRIIRPLRLTGTYAPGDDPRIHGPHARGYEAVPTADGGTRWADVTAANPSLQWSAAAMVSTAADLDRFVVALFSGDVVPEPQLELMFTVPDVPAYDGNDDPTDDLPAYHSAGLSQFTMDGLSIWGKSGDRPGYNSGAGATRDLSRRLVYSVNTIHMGGSEQPAIAQRIIQTAYFGAAHPTSR